MTKILTAHIIITKYYSLRNLSFRNFRILACLKVTILHGVLHDAAFKILVTTKKIKKNKKLHENKIRLCLAKESA